MTIRNWIKLSESKPPYWLTVLFSDNLGNLFIGEYQDNSFLGITDAVYQYFVGTVPRHVSITHWRLMPAPPTLEERK